jgi:hypothetical protein
MDIDLTTWNLCTPELDPETGRAKIYSTAEVQTLSNAYFRRGVDAKGYPFVAFYAPVAGATTQSTDRTRSELRETRPDGALYNWTIPSGDHFLRAALAVYQAPSNGVTVVGQIHSKLGAPLVKLKWKRGWLVASVRSTPDSDPVDTPLFEAPLGTRFSYSLHLTPGGTLSVGSKIIPIDALAWRDAPLYFKVGVYNQDGVADTLDEASDATFWKLSAAH